MAQILVLGVSMTSSTVTLFNVMFPLFVTVITNSTVSPSEISPFVSLSVVRVAALLTFVTAGSISIGVITELESVDVISSDTTEAVFTTWPASASACVTICVPVRTQVAPGATVAQVKLAGVS